MGIWDSISSTIDSVKNNAPVLTPVKNFCGQSYNYGRNAINAVGVNAVAKANQYWPDQESRSEIGEFATKFAKNAVVVAGQEGIKSVVPGGGFLCSIGSKTLRDTKSSKDPKKEEMESMKTEAVYHREEMKALKAEMAEYKKEIKALKAEVGELKKDGGFGPWGLF
ncbi:hypothetical protein HS088_TW21G00483 [Tripterygium wilfordii]|uniref:Uncharacterized protein n=1 Tax=Tripterygium wilfordii TaxID=458696 RepID=A0A7J7C3J7_TRIWF|nr:hypothetical protein HS088_TW21G00483 [Tripterygium wilfordii]